MFNIFKKILISAKKFTKTDYESLKRNIGLYKKQFDRF